MSNVGDITVDGCVFIDNVTIGPGGAMYAFGTGGGDTTLINCTFAGNTSDQGGGGVYNDRIGVSKILGCLFLGNSGSFGAGLTDRANATIVNCLFSGNAALRELSSETRLNDLNTSSAMTRAVTHPEYNLTTRPASAFEMRANP